VNASPASSTAASSYPRGSQSPRHRAAPDEVSAPARDVLPATDGVDGEEVVDVDDLDTLVRQQLPALLRYAAALTGDRDLAGDVVQEVLLRVHSRWRRIALLERPDLYLRRMVTNEVTSWRRRWHVRTVRPASAEVLAARADPLPDHADRVADHDVLSRALAQLTARQRSVVVLRYYEGLDDGEIAQVLGTSRATVRSHASHALAALRTAPEVQR